MDDKKFSVLDMVDQYSADNNISAENLFNVEEKVEDEIKKDSLGEKTSEGWVPSKELISDMPELTEAYGAVYEKDEIKLNNSEGLKNISDEMAIRDSLETMDDLTRKQVNIETAKKRNGISKLQIPPGELQTRFLIAASDPNFDEAQRKLDELFKELMEKYPEFIIEKDENIKDNEEKVKISNNEISENNNVLEENIIEEDTDTKVIIDKKDLSDISWSEEEINKIKKSRSIELNIVESTNIKIGDIEDIEDTVLDNILEQYERKTNDVVAALPASKYRATFTGLSYPEVLDLSTSTEMNSLDGEWKKWSICFNHLKNPSIGEFEEYYIYKENNKEIKVKTFEEVPTDEYHKVTKFEDFLRKTSFMDLDFMLWKILCATTKNQEIISIDCHAINNGKECGKTYDWVYSPESLLDINSISPAILDEMKEVGESSTFNKILEVYKTSSVSTTNSVELVSSGFVLGIGHVDAYTYLTQLYGLIKSLENSEENDPTILSRGMLYSTLVVIKYVLLPKGEGKWVRISSPEGIVRILSTLDEVDWQTISEITKMAIEPYQFRYSLKDIICPQCKNKSDIEIEDMSRMLFILAQSLSSVQVILKKD